MPWNGSFITASGNLMADFQLNVTAEAQGRLQVARLFNMTDDPGVKNMLRFLLARDTMHQNMWMAATEQLKEDGLEEMPVPERVPGLQGVHREVQLHVPGLLRRAPTRRRAAGRPGRPRRQGRVPLRPQPARARARAGPAARRPAALRHEPGPRQGRRQQGQEQAHLTPSRRVVRERRAARRRRTRRRCAVTEFVLRPLADAFMQVGVYVAVMVALFGWLRWRYGDRVTDGLTSRPRLGPLVGALLGVSPGCGGAIILMPLYARGKVSFGTVVAALAATMGDSSWVVLAWNPVFALKIHALLFAVGLVTGYVVDALGIDPARAVNHRVTAAPAPVGLAAVGGPDLAGVAAAARRAAAPRAGVHGVLGADHAGVRGVGAGGLPTGRPGRADPVLRGRRSVPGAGGARLARRGADLRRGAGEAGRRQPGDRAAPLVAGDVAAQRARGVLRHRLGGRGVPGLAGGDHHDGLRRLPARPHRARRRAGRRGIGLIPGCAVQIVFTGLYVSGGLPLPTLVANAISQDGDALIPLAALRRHSAVLATVVTTVPAAAVGAALLVLL